MEKKYPRYYLLERSAILYYFARSYDDICYVSKTYRKKEYSCDFFNKNKLLKSPDFIREILPAELVLMEF